MVNLINEEPEMLKLLKGIIWLSSQNLNSNKKDLNEESAVKKVLILKRLLDLKPVICFNT